MFKIRVRYAPSPTGIPHIGNIRTALYNYLFARNQKGEFILRIEDTDRARFIPEAVPIIEESLKLLNLQWDKKEQQSQRLDLYVKSRRILEEKNAIYQKDGAWYFKVPKNLELSWQDAVHGKVNFSSDVIEDFVIVKSDGYPTYHFASVVDDHDMQISHVFRGDEWISSTPKHLLLYRAFGWDSPVFVHLPPILGPDKKKLSKREGAKSVIEYLKEGYLPEALVNYLALLGWSPSPSEALSEGGKREKEIFSLDELIKVFSIERLNKNSPIFSLEKLKWMNGQWIRRLNEKDYVNKIIDFYNTKYSSNVTTSVAPLTQDRISTLSDYSKIADFFYNPPKIIPQIEISADVITQSIEAFNKTAWNANEIKETIDQIAKEQKVDRVKLIAAIRNIISGTTVTPPLYESLEKLGKEEAIKRLKSYAGKK